MGLFKDFYSTGGASFSALSEMKQFMNHRGPAIESVSLALLRRSSRWKKGQRNPRTLGTVANSNEAGHVGTYDVTALFSSKKVFLVEKSLSRFEDKIHCVITMLLYSVKSFDSKHFEQILIILSQ